jgi:hypothetical protein
MSTSPIARTTVTNVLPGTEQGQTLRWDTGAVQWQANSDLIVDDTGNVGIGTAAPSVLLHVSKADTNRITVENTGGGQAGATFVSGAESTRLYHNGVNFSIQNLSAGSLIFNNNGAESMRINATGNVGIGTTAPAANHRLELENTTDVRMGMMLSGAMGTNIIEFHDTTGRHGFMGYSGSAMLFNQERAANIQFNTSGTERARIDASGNLSVGRTGSTIDGLTHRLLVENVTQVCGGFYRPVTGPNQVLNVYSDNFGVATLAYSIRADGSTVTGSDYRAKTIEGPHRDVLEALSAVPIYRGYLTAAGAEHSRAILLAHELQDAFPEYVTGEKDGERPQAVSYDGLIPVLVKAIQELTARVEALEA